MVTQLTCKVSITAGQTPSSPLALHSFKLCIRCYTYYLTLEYLHCIPIVFRSSFHYHLIEKVLRSAAGTFHLMGRCKHHSLHFQFSFPIICYPQPCIALIVSSLYPPQLLFPWCIYENSSKQCLSPINQIIYIGARFWHWTDFK